MILSLTEHYFALKLGRNVPSTQTLLGYGNLVPPLLNLFDDSIVKGRTDGANFLALAVRPGAIGEQHDG